MTSESQKRASAKYDASNTISMRLKLNVNTEVDIIDRLEKVGNKSGYIKQLIREDIRRERDGN
jgi:hypothetical protein